MMSTIDQNDLSQDNRAVDVSTAETQYRVQCDDVRLFSSLLRPLMDEDGEQENSRFSFKISAFIHNNEAQSQLETQVVYVTDSESDEIRGYFLRFGFLAKFIAGDKINPEEMSDFASLYTLSILWPYAREYASDQLRRTGEKFISLPIINPQVVTEHLIEEDLVEIIILDNSSDEETG